MTVSRFAVRKACRRPFRKRARGFTLVELVIVGALIALFSSLAIFGVQQQFRSNIKKATIGEARNIAVALDFANLDVSVFPKLCWLIEGEQGLRFVSEQISAGESLLAFAAVDHNGRGPADFTALRSFASRTATKWKGPYFSLSQSRAGLAQGRGGWIYAIVPELSTAGDPNPNNPTAGGGGLRWPADPYNNPYVVYMLDIDRTSATVPFLKFVNEDSPEDPTRKGNYINAVVSYGPNHYPGGDEFARQDFGPLPGGDVANVAAPGNNAFSLRLYKGGVGYRPQAKGVITHTMLNTNEWTRPRANIWSREFALANIGLYPGGVTSLPNNGTGTSAADVVGITDIGTDDVIFEF